MQHIILITDINSHGVILLFILHVNEIYILNIQKNKKTKMFLHFKFTEHSIQFHFN